MSKELSTQVDVFCGVEYRLEQVSQQFGDLPQTQAQAIKLAEFYSRSDAVPKEYIGRPGNVLVAIGHGAEVGLKPLISLQSIAVINGRPSLWGDAMLGLVLIQGDNEGVDESFDVKTHTATCLIKRKSRKDITWTFSFADAKAAGIFDRGVWKTYPRRMAQMRARSFAIRDMWPDVLKGLSSAEEQRDIAEAKDITSQTERLREQTIDQSSSESLAAELGLATKAAEVEVKEKSLETKRSDDFKRLILAICDCKTLTELKTLVDRCAALPIELKDGAKSAYAAKQKQLKGLSTKANKDPDICFKCNNKHKLSTCRECGHEYCSTHWGIADDRCETCVGLDDLVAEDN